MLGRRLLTLLAAVAMVAAACTGDDGDSDDQGDDAGGTGAVSDDYEAEIVRTDYGVPHVTGSSLADVVFGQAYAFAEDHGCSLFDQIVKVKGERASFHGAGEEDEHLNSDLAYRHLDVVGRAEASFPELDEEVRTVVTAYAAGVNAHLEEVGAEGLSGWCAGEPWVEAIEPVELYAYYRDLALLASSRQLLDFMATAQPPESGGEDVGGDGDDDGPSGAEAAIGPQFEPPALGSNGWAIGSDRSGLGGLLLANPHFPWAGELRLWESHLEVPGEYEVYGASLLGTPGVLVGFNEAVAWTHTVSAGDRFTAYTLDLADGDPTTYLVDGEERAMTPTDISVEVMGDGGATETVEQTLWATEYGPVIDFPGVGWTEEQTITFRDANIDNDALIPQFLAMNQAESLEDFQAAHEEHQGIPWVNTIAAAADGRVWYADTAATPNLSDEAIEAYLENLESDPFTQIAADNGAVLLDGSDSTFAWVEVDGARSPGLVPFADMPQLERTDVVFNANDPYWMANPDERIEGDFSPLHGLAEQPLSPRTRQNAETLAEGDPASGQDGLFEFSEVSEALFAGESLTAEEWLADVLAVCDAVDVIDPAPCEALAGWGGTFTKDDPGAALWRGFVDQFDGEAFFDEGELFAEPFDAEDPIDTPSGLALDQNGVLQALDQAAADLQSAGFELDASMGDVQFAAPKADERIGVPGGGFREGLLNAVGRGGFDSSTEPGVDLAEPVREDARISTDGYPVTTGSSFIMVVEYSDDGPYAEALLTYGQSGDPGSRHFDDQTEIFSEERLRAVLWDDADIAEAATDTYTVSAGS